MKTLLIILSIIFMSKASQALEIREEYLIKSSYEEIRYVADQVVSQFPPNEHIYVGVGRSPTPLIAFLQALDNNLAINFPLSSFRFSDGDMDEKTAKVFEQHFESLLSQKKVAGKKIVFIDYMESGETLFSVQKFYKHLKQKRKNIPHAQSIGLTSEGQINIPHYYQGSGLKRPRIIHLTQHLGKSIKNQEWKDLAEYEKTNLNSLTYGPAKKASPNYYRTLKKEFSKMQRDDRSQDLREILKKLLGSINKSSKCYKLLKSLGAV